MGSSIQHLGRRRIQPPPCHLADVKSGGKAATPGMSVWGPLLWGFLWRISLEERVLGKGSWSVACGTRGGCCCIATPVLMGRRVGCSGGAVHVGVGCASVEKTRR
jgi:hypothetical protein